MEDELKSLRNIIDSIEYGDITRNSLIDRLETLYSEIEQSSN